jgi:hypothetical protein
MLYFLCISFDVFRSNLLPVNVLWLILMLASPPPLYMLCLLRTYSKMELIIKPDI